MALTLVFYDVLLFLLYKKTGFLGYCLTVFILSAQALDLLYTACNLLIWLRGEVNYQEAKPARKNPQRAICADEHEREESQLLAKDGLVEK
jgi:hypothetical protein